MKDDNRRVYATARKALQIYILWWLGSCRALSTDEEEACGGWTAKARNNKYWPLCFGHPNFPSVLLFQNLYHSQLLLNSFKARVWVILDSHTAQNHASTVLMTIVLRKSTEKD